MNMDEMGILEFPDTKGNIYAVALKKLKQFSYTTFDEGNNVYEYEKIYRPVFNVRTDFWMRHKYGSCVVYVEDLGNGMVQELSSGMLLHLIQFSGEYYGSVDAVAADITEYQHSFLCIEKGDLHPIDQTSSKKHAKTLSVIDDIEELLYIMNLEASENLERNLISLTADDMLKQVNGRTFHPDKVMTKMHQSKKMMK